MSRFLSALLLPASINLIFCSNAYAYFDPGTGSLIIQVLAGVGAFVALSWSNLKIYVRSIIGNRKSNSDLDKKSNDCDTEKNDKQ